MTPFGLTRLEKAKLYTNGIRFLLLNRNWKLRVLGELLMLVSFVEVQKLKVI